MKSHLISPACLPQGSSIYAVTEEPGGGFLADYAVLMCYPFGEEYMRSHKAFRHLAELLARKGVVSMRFDYIGTGDSSGRSSQFNLAAAVEQIVAMIEEIKQLAGVDEVRMVGFRLGAALAYTSAGQVQDVSRLGCWDPIISGRDYLDAMRKTIEPDREYDYIVDDTWWVAGFPLSPQLRDEFNQLHLLQNPGDDCDNMLLLASQENPLSLEFRKLCEQRQREFSYQLLPNPEQDKILLQDANGSYRFNPHTLICLADWLTA